MRARLVPLLVLLLLLAGGAPVVAEEAAPGSLKELGERLEELAKRIEKLVEEARKDPDERKIRIYNGYSSDELKLKRRTVHAHMLVDFMVDPTKNHNVREMASKAIQRGASVRGDPELSLDEKQGRVSRRAYFCQKYLVNHLQHDDARARKFTHELLVQLWRVSNVLEITRYDPNDEKTHRPAKNAWKKYLKRQ